MTLVIIIVIIILVVIAGACFMLGLIPGTDPYHKKKLTDAIKSQESDDLLLTEEEPNKETFFAYGGNGKLKYAPL